MSAAAVTSKMTLGPSEETVASVMLDHRRRDRKASRVARLLAFDEPDIPRWHHSLRHLRPTRRPQLLRWRYQLLQPPTGAPRATDLTVEVGGGAAVKGPDWGGILVRPVHLFEARHIRSTFSVEVISASRPPLPPPRSPLPPLLSLLSDAPR